MNVDFPEALVKAIVCQVVAEVTQQLKKEDRIFDVDSLADYLHVNQNWIYQRTRHYEIPFVKKGKLLFFRKSAIDKWLTEDERKPLPVATKGKRK